MADIEINPMALFILTKGLSLVKISFFGGMGGCPQSIFYPGDLEIYNSACIISNQFETKLHWQIFDFNVF